jgi:hypothetical protein
VGLHQDTSSGPSDRVKKAGGSCLAWQAILTMKYARIQSMQISVRTPSRILLFSTVGKDRSLPEQDEKPNRWCNALFSLDLVTLSSAPQVTDLDGASAHDRLYFF